MYSAVPFLFLLCSFLRSALLRSFLLLCSAINDHCSGWTCWFCGGYNPWDVATTKACWWWLCWLQGRTRNENIGWRFWKIVHCICICPVNNFYKNANWCIWTWTCISRFKTSSYNFPEAKGLVSPCFYSPIMASNHINFFLGVAGLKTRRNHGFDFSKKSTPPKKKNRKESTSLQKTCIEPKFRSVSIHKHGREVIQPPITKKWVFFFWISTTAVDGRNPPNLVRIKNLLGFITNLNWCEPDFFHQRSDSCGEI